MKIINVGLSVLISVGLAISPIHANEFDATDESNEQSVVNNDDTKMKFVIEHNNTNTSSNLSNHGVNNSSGTLYFNVDSKINRSASLACANQENKIINLVKGDSKILPNLLVDNYDVSASHSAYISDFDKESMFYLKSRGISDNEARRLLLEGFLIGNLDVDDETKKNLLSYIKI